MQEDEVHVDHIIRKKLPKLLMASFTNPSNSSIAFKLTTLLYKPVKPRPAQPYLTKKDTFKISSVVAVGAVDADAVAVVAAVGGSDRPSLVADLLVEHLGPTDNRSLLLPPPNWVFS